MQAPRYAVIKNGTFVPAGLVSKYNVVYDENRQIVEKSCVLRLKKDGWSNESQPLPRLPEELSRQTRSIDKRLVFLGQFDQGHWGHLLTEGFARYWFLLKEQIRHPLIPRSKPKTHIKGFLKRILKPGYKENWEQFFNCFGLTRHNILATDVPITAREIIVPECTWYAQLGEAHGFHWDVGRHIGRSLVRNSDIGRDSRPVYISRTKLNRSISSYQGEMPIEQYCRGRGFRIVYPERMSLQAQARLVNKHDVFIGLRGSAFHTLLFRFIERRATAIYLRVGDRQGANYRAIDDLMGNEAQIIDCVRRIPDRRMAFACDSEMAMSGISEALADTQGRGT